MGSFTGGGEAFGRGVNLQAAAEDGCGAEDYGASDVVNRVEVGDEIGLDLVGEGDDLREGICNSVAYPVAHVASARTGVCKGKMAFDLENVDRAGEGCGADGGPNIYIGGGEGTCEDVGPATANV